MFGSPDMAFLADAANWIEAVAARIDLRFVQRSFKVRPNVK